MKVVHLINTLSVGGAELQLLTLSRELRRRGVEVAVICLRETVPGNRSLRPDFERDGIQVYRVAGDGRYSAGFLVEIPRILDTLRPTILHTHLPRPDIAAAVARLLGRRTPWVSSVHGIYTAHWSGRWLMPVWRALWRHTDAGVAISSAVKEWLVTKQRISPAHVVVIPYGIDPERFAHPSVDLRTLWGLGSGPIVGAVGRLEPVKGFQTLIEAGRFLQMRIPNITILIAGNDAFGYGKALAALIEEHGLAGVVRLMGFQRDVVSLLHALDVFVFPSYSEGFGQVLVEAMAAGTPVVASRIGATNEIVGDTGRLVAPGDAEGFADAIVEVLTDSERRAQMAAAGRQRVAEFTIGRMTDAMMTLYETLSEKIG